MQAYRVTLKEEPEDRFTLVFDCYADDEDHAEEQALDFYKNGVILNITIKEDAYADA